MSKSIEFQEPNGDPCFIIPDNVSSISADTDHGPHHTRLIVGGALQVVRGDLRDVKAKLGI